VVTSSHWITSSGIQALQLLLGLLLKQDDFVDTTRSKLLQPSTETTSLLVSSPEVYEDFFLSAMKYWSLLIVTKQLILKTDEGRQNPDRHIGVARKAWSRFDKTLPRGHMITCTHSLHSKWKQRESKPVWSPYLHFYWHHHRHTHAHASVIQESRVLPT